MRSSARSPSPETNDAKTYVTSGPPRGADSDIPIGWTYNPSSWFERLWLVAVALVGFAVSGYLALYQLGYFSEVWEPFFGTGSADVLHSALSRVLPIPDAALGAAAYVADGITGVIGARDRWRSMPWMVILFGLAVGPLGLVSILLVIAQPVVLHAWCTLCLVSALISLIMIGPAMDEVLASLQFLRRSHERNLPLWKVFWHGAQEMYDIPNSSAPQIQRDHTYSRSVAGTSGSVAATSVRSEGHGVWTQLLVAAVGIGIMALPDVMSYQGPERLNDQIVGPLIVSAAMIAAAETTRAVRWVNVVLGCWLVIAPVILQYEPLHIGVRSSVLGIVVAGLSWLSGRRTQELGGGWKRLWTSKSAQLRLRPDTPS
ncbi:MAG TPA: vitamin K epoxide reductase family protein [Nitrospira sp.]|nr:vitamin K epoxide reductase family protein [Nitrospira sp.]